MFGFNRWFACQVGDGACEFADFVVGACGQAELGHRVLEHHFAGSIDGAEFFDLFVAHPRVGHNFTVAETSGLECAGFYDISPYGGGIELA